MKDYAHFALEFFDLLSVAVAVRVARATACSHSE